jgi:gluconolactonase
MRARTSLTAITVLAAGAMLAAQGQAPPKPEETTATAIPGVIAAGTKVEVIKSGFTGTEGPIAASDGSLIFTETQANRITRIDKDTNQTSTFLENTNGANGLAWDSKGRLLSVQTTPGATKIGVLYPKGMEATLTDNFDGKPYGRPNDLVVSTRGAVYFTEPGPNATPGQPPSPPPLAPAVYFVPPGGKPQRIADGIERPNGIMLSPDEKTLYVNNTNGEYIIAFDVGTDGTVSNRRNFAKYPSVNKTQTGGFNSGADGLAVDSQGRLYTVAVGGVQVFSPKGEHLGTIPVVPQPQNLAFAGADKKTLYIVGRGSAWKVRMLAEGFKGRAK